MSIGEATLKRVRVLIREGGVVGQLHLWRSKAWKEEAGCVDSSGVEIRSRGRGVNCAVSASKRLSARDG